MNRRIRVLIKPFDVDAGLCLLFPKPSKIDKGKNYGFQGTDFIWTCLPNIASTIISYFIYYCVLSRKALSVDIYLAS